MMNIRELSFKLRHDEESQIGLIGSNQKVSGQI
jgi:hypothetical protein